MLLSLLGVCALSFLSFRTDKWSKTELGTKWGDKWEEKFFGDVGSRQGETWHVTPDAQRKEIAKPITPPSKSASKEDNDPEQAQRDKDMHKILALIANYFKNIYKPNNNNLKTSSNSRNKNVDTTQRPRRVKDSTYHKEKMLLCKQAEQSVPLQPEHVDWLADTDDKINEQELEAHYSFMAKIQEDDSDVTPDSPDMCESDIQTDQNANDERVALANLIATLKLDVDKNKKIQKKLEKVNTSLAHELEQCKSILAETIVKEKHDELVKQSLLTKSHYEGLVKEKTRPWLRTIQIINKVVPINSHVKAKKTKSVTTCNDSLKSRTSNVNVVCAICGKCLIDSNHFACVTKLLYDVNARTNKHNVVPISTIKPKSQAKKSVATPRKKTVASETTTQNSKSYYRMLHEKTSKAWKWWIKRQCPSGYKWVPKKKSKWVPKTQTKWVPKVRNENLEKRVSFAIDNVSRITNVLKITNTLGSNLPSIPSSFNSLADCSTHPIHR
nr:hypothetical protein [Tanacetum cinerariifolium]